MFQSKYGWISNHSAGSLVIGKSTLETVEMYEDKGSMDLGKCQPVPLNNRCQVLENLHDDQARIFGCSSKTDSPVQDSSWIITASPPLLPKLKSQVSCSSSTAVAGILEQKVVHGSDPVSHSGDTSDTNSSFLPEFHKCKAQIGTKFICVPLTPIYVYKGPSRVWNQIPDVLTAHKLSGILNFLNLRIPVQTDLNVSSWHFGSYFQSLY